MVTQSDVSAITCKDAMVSSTQVAYFKKNYNQQIKDIHGSVFSEKISFG